MGDSSGVRYLPGDVVGTAFGLGVLIHCPDPDTGVGQYQARLWRIPGKSLASSSVAYLQSDMILEKLPAAPGMVTSTLQNPEQQIMIHCFYASRRLYLASPVKESDVVAAEPKTALSPTSAASSAANTNETSFSVDECFEIPPEEVKDAPSAKFYPMLHDLVKRANEVASATADFVRSDRVAHLVEKSSTLLESSRQSGSIVSPEDISASVKTAIPDEEAVKQVYTMLKDEDLTVLLQKGRERLQELVEHDVPQATEVALQKAGIAIAGDSQSSSVSESLIRSRETALAALKTLLDDIDVDTADLQSIRDQLGENFTTMFDSLAQAAKSDRTLNSIFDTISDRTLDWQKSTGRIMSSKSVSLFLEGASRLQARAANILSMEHMHWAGDIGTKFTKAFTERDAAVARLKSIELGDAVRSRLVNAIEVRSASYGGLDGIIGGALTTLTQAGDVSGDRMQDMLKLLQSRATDASKDAHETLISVISQRSQYHDAALLRIERVLCDLESQLGDDLSPTEIAALVRGEGGTASLFEPIARRAATEIEKGLDTAEASVEDPTILSALNKVRTIVSGELSVDALVDEVLKLLNDESVVAASESFVKHGELVLDAIEGVSGNKMVGDVMEIAEKAGITKDSVVSKMESLNVEELLDTAGSAVSDEKARRELISSATDVALDFILRILPSMSVPPFDGVKEGLVYHLSNLSMEGFKVRKENILVEVAGMRATQKQTDIPAVGDSSRDASSVMTDEVSDFDAASSDSLGGDKPITTVYVPKDSSNVKATELLIIDVQQISAVLDNVVWSFEQTYMPYLKGSGKADVKLSDGAIRLLFELRKKRRMDLPIENNAAATQWEPVLCLHDRSCSIGEVGLSLQGEGRLTWVFNKLASIFKGPLRDYVVRNIMEVLTSRSGYILEQLNTNLSPYWGLIMRTAGLTLDDLAEASAADIIAALPEDVGLVELVWRENLPLGMNLLLNDDSGLLKIVDFPRGSQARAVCDQRQIDPDLFKGATIVAVNGSRYDTREQLFNALKDPGRPKSILFELADPEDAERIKRFVEGNDVPRTHALSVEDRESNRENTFSIKTVTFAEKGPLGIEFADALDSFGLFVSDFLSGDDGIVLAAEREPQISRGDLLTHINGELVVGEDGRGKEKALTMLESCGNERPLSLSFTEPHMFMETFEKPPNGVSEFGGPDEFILVEKQLSDSTKRIAVDDFDNISGVAEAGGILIGDHLAFINGVPLGAGCRFLDCGPTPELHEIYAMLRDSQAYPIGLTFARPQKTARRWTTGSPSRAKFGIESCETICITADSFEHIGCVFESKDETDIVVTDLFAVPGPIQSKMRHYRDMLGNVHLSIESVNGQFVPSYATPDIVKNAMKRTWASNGCIEVVFCDDTKKKWVRGLS